MAEYAKKFSLGHGSFLGPRSETKWNATDTFRPGGEGDRVAELMIINFSESGHSTFRATSALEQGTLQIKGGGTLSTNFCKGYDNVELFSALLSLSITSVCTEQYLCEEFTLRLANTRQHVSQWTNQSNWFYVLIVEHSKTTSDL